MCKPLAMIRDDDWYTLSPASQSYTSRTHVVLFSTTTTINDNNQHVCIVCAVVEGAWLIGVIVRHIVLHTDQGNQSRE